MEGDEAGEAAAPEIVAAAPEIVCAECGLKFISRNLLFKHLRSPSVSCGDADQKAVVVPPKRSLIVRTARGELTPEEKAALREKNARKQARAEQRKQNELPMPKNEDELARELWIGGLVASVASIKGLKNVLWLAADDVVSKLPLPVPRMLKRRGYRQDGAWMGYAFVVCRDREEATAWRNAIDLKELTIGKEMVTLKARPAAFKTTRRDGTQRDAAAVDEPSDASRSLAAGANPSDWKIFLAWPTSTLERRAQAAGTSVQALAEGVRDGVQDGARADCVPYTHVSGVRVPRSLVAALSSALRQTLWPAAAQRNGVETETYLVLRRQVTAGGGDPYEDLKAACEAVMAWANPSFAYDHLAITKNFVSSPHVDMRDESFQYAMAVGDYSGGGELCVESGDGARRWRIDTRERLAKFDGRSVHWVRGYRGERFSVVWYVNREEHATAQEFDVDAEWSPHGERADTSSDEDDDSEEEPPLEPPLS